MQVWAGPVPPGASAGRVDAVPSPVLTWSCRVSVSSSLTRTQSRGIRATSLSLHPVCKDPTLHPATF